MTYDDLSIEQLVRLHEALDDIKSVYVWALSQEHIQKPLAYAIYQVWKEADKEEKK